MRVSTTTKTTVKSTWNLRGGICSLTGRPKIVCCTGMVTGAEKERHGDYGDMGGCSDWESGQVGICIGCVISLERGRIYREQKDHRRDQLVRPEAAKG